MKVLVCIPHFYGHQPSAAGAIMGSSNDPADLRSHNISRCVGQISSILSQQVLYSGTSGSTKVGSGIVCFDAIESHTKNISGDIFLCTHKDSHLVSKISTNIITRQFHSNRPPQELGFSCRDVFAGLRDEYDLYCFIEDDMFIADDKFFEKILNFYEAYGDNYVISPNRFEVWGKMDARWKVYLEGAEPPLHRIRSYDAAPEKLITSSNLGTAELWIAPNMCSGCYVISRTQLKKWIELPDFFKPDPALIGKMDLMEIAQIPFRGRSPIYKPSPSNASFLETHHTPDRVVNSKTPWNAVSSQIHSELSAKRSKAFQLKRRDISVR